MRNNNRSWIVVFMLTLFIAACDSPTEPACGVYASLVPADVVRPGQWSNWVTFLVTNECEEEEIVETVSMTLTGEAVMTNVCLMSGTTYVSPFINFIPVAGHENGVRLPLAPIDPLVVAPHQSMWFSLRAELADTQWVSGFTIRVDEVKLKSGRPVYGLPLTHTVIMGPGVGIVKG